jgi:hypothetical protein
MSKKAIIAQASVTGSSHLQSGTPCQDSSAVWLSPDGEYLISIISDGAGSCSHSHVGSAFVVKKTLDILKDRIEKNKWFQQRVLPDSIQWKKELFFIFKAIKLGIRQIADEVKTDYKAFSCTIMLAVSTRYGMAYAHIGDGRAAIRTEDEEWKAAINPMKGEEANQTVFITSELWDETLVSAYFDANVIQESITAIALLTDGCERASFEMLSFDEETGKYFDPNKPFKPFFEPNYHNLFKMKWAGFSQDKINRLWAGFLENGNPKLKAESDDKTMILAVFEPDNTDEKTI